jgi:hypothetical protein
VANPPAEEIISWLTRETPYDDSDSESGYSFIFPQLELSLWRPSRPEDVEPIEEDASEADRAYFWEEFERARYFATVGLGMPGYYSNG